jgi:hypothetical protein
MKESLYIVQVTEDDEIYQYEYSNLKHAKEHFINEQNALLLEYKDGKHYIVEMN